MAKHIGIVGVSPEGTALCYREIFRQAASLIGDHGHPTVTIHNEPLERYIDAAMHDDWHTVGELLKRSAGKLAAAGAEFCIVPDNLMQNGVHLAEVGSPIPWLTMTELVAEALERDQRGTVGLIGTKMVMFGSIYQTVLGMKGVRVLVPDESEAERLDRIIFGQLVFGRVGPASRGEFEHAVEELAERGCEGLVLGCTEAPLVIDQTRCRLPIYDPGTLLAEGAVRCALGQRELRPA